MVQHIKSSNDISAKRAIQSLRRRRSSEALILSLVHDPEFRLVSALIPSKGEVDELTKALVCIFGSNDEDKLLRFFSQLLEDEVTNLTHSGQGTQLLRSNTPSIKVISEYSYLIGAEYLKTILTEELQTIVNEPSELYEVNSVTDSELLEQNVIRTEQSTQRILNRILNSTSYIPPQLSRICYYLRKSVACHFETHTDSALGGFLFLRVFCPAILIPYKARILASSETTTLNPKIHRGLLFVAKLLQNLANNVLFGLKEPYMTVFNPFIRRNYSGVVVFYDEICSMAAVHEETIHSLPQNQPINIYQVLKERMLRQELEHSPLNSDLEHSLSVIRDRMNLHEDYIASHILTPNSSAKMGGGCKFDASDEFLLRKPTHTKLESKFNARTEKTTCHSSALRRLIFRKSLPSHPEAMSRMNRSKTLDPGSSLTDPLSVSNSNVSNSNFEFSESFCANANNSMDKAYSDNEHHIGFEHDNGVTTQVSPEQVDLVIGTESHRDNQLMKLYYSDLSLMGLKYIMDASLPYPQLDLYDDMEYRQLKNEKQRGMEWQLWKVKNGVTLFKRKTCKNSIYEIKGTITIQADSSQVFHFLQSQEGCQLWDNGTISVRDVEVLDSEKSLMYRTSSKRSLWPFKLRDACHLCSYFTETGEAATFAIIFESVVRQDVPLVKGYTRDYMLSSGFVIRSIEPNVSVLTYIHRCDMKGVLPQPLQVRSNKKQVLVLSKIKDKVEKSV